jgi:hypothetical protein
MLSVREACQDAWAPSLRAVLHGLRARRQPGLRRLAVARALAAPGAAGLRRATTGPPPHRAPLGMASWYGRRWQGYPSASGARSAQAPRTAAHRTAPRGPQVGGTNLATRRVVLSRTPLGGPHASAAPRALQRSRTPSRDSTLRSHAGAGRVADGLATAHRAPRPASAVGGPVVCPRRDVVRWPEWCQGQGDGGAALGCGVDGLLASAAAPTPWCGVATGPPAGGGRRVVRREEGAGHDRHGLQGCGGGHLDDNRVAASGRCGAPGHGGHVAAGPQPLPAVCVRP